MIRHKLPLLGLILLGATGCLSVKPQWWPIPPYTPVAPAYEVTIAKAGTGLGTVTGPNINCGTACTAGYAQGASVTLTAAPQQPASSFASWSGGCTGTALSCTFTVSGTMTVTANFSASDTIPPPNPGQPTIGTATTGSSTVSFPGTTWTQANDMPSNTPPPSWNWSAGFNDGTWGGSSGTTPPGAGIVTAKPMTVIVPYHTTNAAAPGYFCVVAIDAAGNASGSSCNAVNVPANPATLAKLTATWVAPTTNTDGSALTGPTALASYRVYYAVSPAAACKTPTLITVPAPAVTTAINGLVNGTTYNVAVTAINASGTESGCSNTATLAAHP